MHDVQMAAARARDKVTELENVAEEWARKYGRVQHEAVELERLIIKLHHALVAVVEGRGEQTDVFLAELERDYPWIK